MHSLECTIKKDRKSVTKMRGVGVCCLPTMAGFRTDMEKLIKKFAEKDSLRFDKFVECFKEMQFSLIFSGRTSEAELRDFEEKTFVIVLARCLPPKSTEIQEKVAGVYLLYSLYYSQIPRFRMKIRIMSNQAVQLRLFMTQLRKDGHLDTLYTLRKLINDHAFAFCCFAEDHNPITSKKFDNREDDVETGKKLDPELLGSNQLEAIVADPVTQQVSLLHEKYQSQKREMCRGEPSAALNICNESVSVFVKTLTSEYKIRIERRLGRHEAKVQKQRSPVKDRRKLLKEKAYSGVTKQARHRRHRQEELDEENTQGDEIGQTADVPLVECPPIADLSDRGHGKPRARPTPKPDDKPKVGRPRKKAKTKATSAQQIPSNKSRVAKPIAPKKSAKAKTDQSAESSEPKAKRGRKAEKEPKEKRPIGKPRLNAAVAMPNVITRRTKIKPISGTVGDDVFEQADKALDKIMKRTKPKNEINL